MGRSCRNAHRAGLTLAALSFAVLPFPAHIALAEDAGAQPAACKGDAGGIVLPQGFCATVFADNIGHARHMVVAPNGVVYVNTWSGRYYGNDTPPPGGFLVALQDSDGDGQADMVARFGDTIAQGSAGGTGIAIFDGALYAEVNDKIVQLPAAAKTGLRRRLSRETIVSGLPLTGDHPMHPFAIDDGRQPLRRRRHPRPIPARKRTACRNRPASSPAPSSRRAAASGATTRARPDRHSPRPRATRPASAMPTASPSTADGVSPVRHAARPRRAVGELAEALHARAGRQSARRGAAAGRAGRRLWLARMLFRRHAEQARARAGIWRRRRQDSRGVRAPRRRRSRPSRRIGRLTTSRSMTARSFPQPIAAAPSSPFTARGTARPPARRL